MSSISHLLFRIGIQHILFPLAQNISYAVKLRFTNPVIKIRMHFKSQKRRT